MVLRETKSASDGSGEGQRKGVMSTWPWLSEGKYSVRLGHSVNEAGWFQERCPGGRLDTEGCVARVARQGIGQGCRVGRGSPQPDPD